MSDFIPTGTSLTPEERERRIEEVMRKSATVKLSFSPWSAVKPILGFFVVIIQQLIIRLTVAVTVITIAYIYFVHPYNVEPVRKVVPVVNNYSGRIFAPSRSISPIIRSVDDAIRFQSESFS